VGSDPGCGLAAAAVLVSVTAAGVIGIGADNRRSNKSTIATQPSDASGRAPYRT